MTITRNQIRRYPSPERIEGLEAIFYRGFLKLAFAATLVLLSVGACAPAVSAERSPNIVLILADDLGYGDIGAYNPDSKIATPNIDRLAGQGLRFSDAHSSSVCIPSRYELLTGRHMFRTERIYPESLIEPGRLTLASLLKRAGYATAMIGKWHLGFVGVKPFIRGKFSKFGGDSGDLFDYTYAFNYTEPLRGGPVDHGFDSYFGIHGSLDEAPYFYIENDGVAEAPTGTIEQHHTPGVRFIQGEFWRGGPIAPDFKHGDVLPRFADRAVQYLESRAGSQQPFFLYLALTAPHPPWLPAEQFRGKSGAGPYGDFVMQVDQIVGRLVKALEKSGRTSDTLLIFTSDNGPTWYEADVQKYGHRASGPWRGMKADAWEGGHRIPFIARWPGKIAAGTSSAQLVSFTDMLATFSSLTGQELPKGAGEDSFDVLPVLIGKSSKPIRQAIVHWAFGPDGAIRQGNWKLIASPCGLSMFEGFGDGPKYTNPCLQMPEPGGRQSQLYNLANDPGEQKSVYAEHPEVVQRLTELLERYRREGRSRLD